MKREKINSITMALDCAIRDSKGEEGGYESKKRKAPYSNYMTNTAWDEYLGDIHRDIQKVLKKETSGDPPKMASFGSSCRFVYDTLKDVEGIEFEKILSTGLGGNANLDAFVVKGDTAICVEAKCHEIYIDPSPYTEVYRHLNNNLDGFKFNDNISDFYGDEVPIRHFDIKQLICHFLAIARAVLTKKIEQPKIRFVYLIYNPHKIENYIKEYKDAVLGQYDQCLEEIESIDMVALFAKISEFQRDDLKRKYIKAENIEMPDFEFFLVDQESWEEHFK